MKKIVLLVVLALAGLLAYFLLYSKKSKPHGYEVKQQPVAVSKHSEVFNNSMIETLKNYYALSEAFVNWDSTAIRSNTTSLHQSVSSIKFEEIKADTLIYETADSYLGELNKELNTIAQQRDITAKRHAFHSFSQNLYDLLRTVKYDGEKVFLQECPMAFNDNENGLWLSNKAEIRNPYLGLHHPKYKGGMLICGETKDSLHFTNQTVN